MWNKHIKACWDKETLEAKDGVTKQTDEENEKVMAECRELTTLWVARLDDDAELKVTDPKEQQGDIEEKEAEG